MPFGARRPNRSEPGVHYHAGVRTSTASGAAVYALVLVAGLVAGFAVARLTDTGAAPEKARGTVIRTITTGPTGGAPRTVVRTETTTVRSREPSRSSRRERREPQRTTSGPSTVGGKAVPPAGRRFEGTGSKRLGDVLLRKVSEVRWTSAGPRFRLTYDGTAVAVDSTERSGSLTAPPQLYRDVVVEAKGRWTLVIG
jgi:hypothetical protein